MRKLHCAIAVLAALCAPAAGGTPHRSDWSAVGAAGGVLRGTELRAAARAGQTTVGSMSSSRFLVAVGYWQDDLTTGIVEREDLVPDDRDVVTRLDRVSPNPARDRAVIRYALTSEATVTLLVHDLTGRVVRTLVRAPQRPGRYAVTWDATDNRGRILGNGIYLYRLVAGTYSATEKLMLLR